MKIDRVTFLALCGAIACKAEQQAPVVPIVDLQAVPSATEPPPLAPAPQASAAPSDCNDFAAHESAPTCEGMNDPASSCAPFDFPRSQCDGFTPLLKPRLAEQFVRCMVALSPDDLCDAMKTYACKEKALRGACPDPGIDAYCANEGSQAGPECPTWASGLTDDARQKAASTCGFNWSCMEGLSDSN